MIFRKTNLNSGRESVFNFVNTIIDNFWKNKNHELKNKYHEVNCAIHDSIKENVQMVEIYFYASKNEIDHAGVEYINLHAKRMLSAKLADEIMNSDFLVGEEIHCPFSGSIRYVICVPFIKSK